MSTKHDPAQKYHAAIALLAQSAEHDRANALATILETAASAITLGALHELADTCIQFWAERSDSPHDRHKSPRPARKAHTAADDPKRRK